MHLLRKLLLHQNWLMYSSIITHYACRWHTTRPLLRPKCFVNRSVAACIECKCHSNVLPYSIAIAQSPLISWIRALQPLQPCPDAISHSRTRSNISCCFEHSSIFRCRCLSSSKLFMVAHSQYNSLAMLVLCNATGRHIRRCAVTL